MVGLHRAHARCGRCHAACRAIRAIGGRPGLAVAPCAAWGDRFAAVSRDDCGRPKLEFSQRLSFRKAPPEPHTALHGTTSTLVAFHDDAPAAPRGRGLLRYSAGQRAPACFCTSYKICLGAAGAPSYPRPPAQPHGATSAAAPSSARRGRGARRCAPRRARGMGIPRSDSARPPFSISHLFIFLPALVWPGYRMHGCMPRSVHN